MRFAPFFFFEFQPDSAVSADTGLYGLSRPDLGRVGAAFSRVGANFSRVGPIRELPRGTDAGSAASLPRRRVPPRQTRVCWPGSHFRASQTITDKRNNN